MTLGHSFSNLKLLCSFEHPYKVVPRLVFHSTLGAISVSIISIHVASIINAYLVQRLVASSLCIIIKSPSPGS